MSAAAEDQVKRADPIPFATFLESSPPGSAADVDKFLNNPTGAYFEYFAPTIQLFCPSEDCGGLRYFDSDSRGGYSGRSVDAFLEYRCRHCGKTFKTFALWLIRKANTLGGEVLKYGEWPPFGPPTPPGVFSLVGPDRDAYLKGRRCESQSLGIGAFAYYRRVVENQKERLLREIIRVSERLQVPAATIDTLKSALNETQFSKAVDLAKDAIPQMLLIKGHNPLTLLHKALSEGIHARTDEDCLALAQSIRVILEEFADRCATALKDHAELEGALSRLLNRNVATTGEDQPKRPS